MSAEPKQAVVLDDILEHEVGQFGRFQLLTLFLAAFPIMFSGFTSTEYIFTTARINTRCRIPECDVTELEFTPPWLLNAIPGTNLSSFESCERYDPRPENYTKQPNVSDGVCHASLFDQSLRRDCEAYVYENKLSVVYDFELACDEWRRALIGSLRVAGTLIGFPLTGYISDRWGRRVALTVNSFNAAWIGLMRSFVNSYEWFVAFEMLETIFGSGGFTACYVLMLEQAGPQYRVAAGGTADTIYAIGMMIAGFIAWGIPAWRPLTRVLYIPQFVTILYFWIMTESIRWLITKGRYEDAEEILKKVAKVNRRELSEKSMTALRVTAETENKTSTDNEPYLVTQVLKSRCILYRVLVSPVWWITNMLVYFGMNINAVNLVGNSYLNYIVIAAIEIPAIWTTVFLLNRIGRKPMAIGGYWLCALCQFTFAFLPEDYSYLRQVLYFMGKFFITGVMTSVYIYTAELYPTRYRHCLLAVSSTIGRLGFIAAPLTPALALTVWMPLPSVLFGCFAVLSGALIFTTPETLGTKLPDTFEEADQLGKKKTSS